MPHPCPHHCPKGTGGGAAALLVLAAVAVIAATARAVIHAAELVLEVTAIAAASVTGLAAVGGVAYVVLRAHCRQARPRQALPGYTPRALDSAQRLSGPRAIEAPRTRVIHRDHVKEEYR